MSLTAAQSDALAQFQSITCIADPSVASYILAQCDWDLASAIDVFFEVSTPSTSDTDQQQLPTPVEPPDVEVDDSTPPLPMNHLSFANASPSSFFEGVRAACLTWKSGEIISARSQLESFLLLPGNHHSCCHYFLGRISDEACEYFSAVQSFASSLDCWTDSEDDLLKRFGVVRVGVVSQRGIALLRLGRVKEALSDFDEVLANPIGLDEENLAIIRMNRGTALEMIGQVAEAAQERFQALSSVPNDPEFLFNQAVDLNKTGRNEKALVFIDRAISRLGELNLTPEYCLVRGESLRALERKHEALEAFSRAARIDPRCSEAHNGLGLVHSDLGDEHMAFVSYSEAIKVKPRCGLYYNNRGRSLVQLDRADEALQDYDGAVALEPENPEFRFNRSKCLAHLGFPQEALESISLAVRLAPQNPKYRFARFDVYVQLKQFDLAFADVRTSFKWETDPKSLYFCALRMIQHSTEPEHLELFVNLVLRARSIAGSQRPILDLCKGTSLASLDPATLPYVTFRRSFLLLPSLRLDYVLPYVAAVRHLIDAVVHVFMIHGAKHQAFGISDVTKGIGLICAASTRENAGLSDKLPLIGDGGEVGNVLGDVRETDVCLAYHVVSQGSRATHVVRWVIREKGIRACDVIDCVSVLGIDGDLLSLCSAFQTFYDTHASGFVLRRPERLFQRDLCRMLHRLLLEGLEPWLFENDLVLIIPDRMLFLVPWGALLDEKDRFFIEKYAFSISPSMSYSNQYRLDENLRRDFQKEALNRLVRPLPMQAVLCASSGLSNGLEGVARLLETRFEGCFVCLCGPQFSIQHLESTLSDFSPHLLHIRAHGDDEAEQTDAGEDWSDFPEYAMTGHLSLSGEEVLQPKDVSKFDLRGTGLVFLCSCSLGSGRVADEGIQGFYRAFFLAGVPTVICSLTPMRKLYASKISQGFYSRLFQGIAIAQSLREAILDELRICVGLRENPLMWSSLQVYGYPHQFRISSYIYTASDSDLRTSA